MKSRQLFLPIVCSIAISPLAVFAAEPTHSNSPVGQQDNYEEGEIRDAWMEGKLETAFLLNRQLNNFTIDVEVNGSTAMLEGTVSSEIDRDLAEQVTLNIDGIESVRNNLQVDRELDFDDPDGERDLGSRLSDATLTAEVKIKLLANNETEGLSINVDTVNNVVTLRGDVSSNSVKERSAEVAREVEGVTRVDNQLVVRN